MERLLNGVQGSITDAADRATFDRWFDERFEARMAEREAAHVSSLAIIVTKGTLDWAYPPFILASTAVALGWNVSLFFTFYGLELLKKNLDHLEISPLGNPAMPMKMPFGPAWLKSINWQVPNLVQNLPGFEGFATAMMKKTIAQKGVAGVEELRQVCIESDAKLVACQMTVDLFGYAKEDFIPEVADWIGATTYLPMAAQADVSLFI